MKTYPKGAIAKPNKRGEKATRTQRLYRQWLAGENREGVETALTMICASACMGLYPPCPPILRGNTQSMALFNARHKGRWPWCAAFVRAELAKTTAYDADPDCRYIARRCKQRLIDEIRKENRKDYGAQGRDARGRFTASFEDDAIEPRDDGGAFQKTKVRLVLKTPGDVFAAFPEIELQERHPVSEEDLCWALKQL